MFLQSNTVLFYMVPRWIGFKASTTRLLLGTQHGKGHRNQWVTAPDPVTWQKEPTSLLIPWVIIESQIWDRSMEGEMDVLGGLWLCGKVIHIWLSNSGCVTLVQNMSSPTLLHGINCHGIPLNLRLPFSKMWWNTKTHDSKQGFKKPINKPFGEVLVQCTVYDTAGNVKGALCTNITDSQ